MISPWIPQYHPVFNYFNLFFNNITLQLNQSDISVIPTRFLAGSYNAEGKKSRVKSNIVDHRTRIKGKQNLIPVFSVSLFYLRLLADYSMDPFKTL